MWIGMEAAAARALMRSGVRRDQDRREIEGVAEGGVCREGEEERKECESMQRDKEAQVTGHHPQNDPGLSIMDRIWWTQQQASADHDKTREHCLHCHRNDHTAGSEHARSQPACEVRSDGSVMSSSYK
jgi:hypothetical protein